MEDTPGVISIRKAGEDTRVNLRRVEPWEANKTLGVWMAMDGNQEAEAEYLRGKALDWAETFREASGLERNDAWEGLTTTILNTLKYPACATQLTEAQWEWVMRPAVEVGLQKSGISKHFPRAVLFGPERFHGLGLLHPFDFQELEHLETALRCGNWGSTTGSLVETSMEELKLELGLPGKVTN